jgi:hypothetical protein
MIELHQAETLQAKSIVCFVETGWEDWVQVTPRGAWPGELG